MFSNSNTAYQINFYRHFSNFIFHGTPLFYEIFQQLAPKQNFKTCFSAILHILAVVFFIRFILGFNIFWIPVFLSVIFIIILTLIFIVFVSLIFNIYIKLTSIIGALINFLIVFFLFFVYYLKDFCFVMLSCLCSLVILLLLCVFVNILCICFLFPFHKF